MVDLLLVDLTLPLSLDLSVMEWLEKGGMGAYQNPSADMIKEQEYERITFFWCLIQGYPRKEWQSW